MAIDENSKLVAQDGLRTLVPRPESGRVFVGKRRVRLSDADPGGRLRLDAVARYLQDVAGDDVLETGWGSPDHFWLVRRSTIRQLRPISIEEMVELTTWSSGTASSSASRRTTAAGERGGLIEAESVWVHLSRELRPERFGGDFFEVYGPSANGRRISIRLELPDLPAAAERTRWPLRRCDLDLLGHLNNAAYWQAIEEAGARSGFDLTAPLEAVLEFRRPIDLEDEVELLFVAEERGYRLALTAADSVRAVASVHALA
ncbi:MAG: acyl-ACP thioesterase domain-containing protein [Gaiellaceae bacterium]